jgi:hypothetical protein
MKTSRTYKFRGKVLPDGHLSVPEEVAQIPGEEFEVSMTPIDDIKSLVIQYLEGTLEKKGWFRDIELDSPKVREAVTKVFSTSEIEAIMQSIRK